MTLAPLMSSAKQDWQTPESVLDRVRAVGPIALDPATVPANPTGAARILTPEDDGLRATWSRHLGGPGVVYCNPPYGRELARWAEKAATEIDCGLPAPLLMLVPARTDTRWWSTLADACDSVALWRGRIRFRGASASAPFPSCVFLGLGMRRPWVRQIWRERFSEAFDGVARVVRL